MYPAEGLGVTHLRQFFLPCAPAPVPELPAAAEKLKWPQEGQRQSWTVKSVVAGGWEGEGEGRVVVVVVVVEEEEGARRWGGREGED